MAYFMEGLPTYRSAPFHSRRILTEHQIGGLQRRKSHDVTQHCQARAVDCLADSSKQHTYKTLHMRRANGRPKLLTNTKLTTSDAKEAGHSEWLGIRGVSVKFYISEQKQVLESNRFTGCTRPEESQHRGADKIRAWSIKDTTSASYQVQPMKGILKSCSGSTISEDQRGLCQTMCSRNSFDSSKSPKKVQFKGDVTESLMKMLQRRETRHNLQHDELTHYDDLPQDERTQCDNLASDGPFYSKGDAFKFRHASGADHVLSYDEFFRLAGGLTTGHRCYNNDELNVRFSDGTEGDWAMNKNNQGLDSLTEDNDNHRRPQTVQQDRLLNFTNRPVSTSILKFITKHQNLIPSSARLSGSPDHRMMHMDKEVLHNVTPRQYPEKRPTELATPERLEITPGIVAKHCESILCPARKDHGAPDAVHVTKNEYNNNDETEITYLKNFELEASNSTAKANNETELRSSALNNREMTSTEKTQFIIQWLKEVESSKKIRLPNQQFRPGQLR